MGARAKLSPEQLLPSRGARYLRYNNARVNFVKQKDSALRQKLANADFSPRWSALGGCRKGGAKQAAEKLVGPVILSIDSLSAAHDGQKIDKENQYPSLSS